MLYFGQFAVWNGPHYNAEALSSASKHKKAVVYLTEKICVLDKLSSGMSYSSVGHEFNANESTIYSKYSVFLTETNKIRLCIDRFIKMWPDRYLVLYFSVNQYLLI